MLTYAYEYIKLEGSLENKLFNHNIMLHHALKNGYAIGAYNFSSVEMMRAIIDGCQETDAPVILSLSNSGLKFATPTYLKNVVHAALEITTIPISLHLDHGKDFEIAEEELVGELVSVEVRGNRLFVATQKQIIVVDDMSDMTVVEAQISAFCVNWNGTVMVGCKGSEVMLYEVQNCEVWSVETVTCDVSVKSCKLSDGGLLALSDGATISVYDVRNLSAPVHHVFGKAPIHFEWMCERPLLMFVNEGELRISHVDGEKGSQVVYAKELMSRQVTKVLCTREMVFLESKRSIEIVRWNSRAIPILKL